MSKSEPVRESQSLLAQLRPSLEPGDYVFCTTSDAALVETAQSSTIGLFHEAEGASLILPRAMAEALGFPVALPMRRIVLTVHSALDGVGLTAAVAGALAAEGIPCNVVAAFHHDHVFVPAGMAERALGILEALQAAANVAARERNGVPLLQRGPDAVPAALDTVNGLRDAEH